MGGARCSYRTCTIKSDKKTHLFHFPVFDKIRCHQWIVNAQKLNFLDLKLSQLKNRVVCEHHFTDDCFMNEMKAKLKNTAIPTEDGPYCVKTTNEVKDEEFPINLDDIENEFLTQTEKKAHFSVKYGDFLTNDSSEAIITIPSCNNSQKKIPEIDDTMARLTRNYTLFSPPTSLINSNTTTQNNNKKIKILKIASDAKSSGASSLLQNKLSPNPKVIAIEYEDLNLNKLDHDNKSSELLKFSSEQEPKQECNQSNIKPDSDIKPNICHISKNKKVRILSEKKISEPLRVNKSELQPVSPSIVIKPLKKKKVNVEENNSSDMHTLYVNLSNPPLDNNNVQVFNNPDIMTTETIIPDQICVNEFKLPVNFSNQIDYSNQNMDQFIENKPTDNINTDISNMPMKQHLDLFNQIENITIVPIELDSTLSTNEPNCVFTMSSGVPEDTTLLNNSSYVHSVSKSPKNVQNTTLISTDLSNVSSNNKNTLLSNVSNNSNNIQNNSNNTQNVSNKLKSAQSIILNKKIQSLPNSLSPNKNTMKNKMAPEKLAAIEEKRKFNIKLRDIINSCLNNIDEEPDTGKLSETMKKALNDKKVEDHLSKIPKFPTKQENTISYLETRLQRMEDTLLNKIEQNTQRIADLKRTLKPSTGKRSAYTQTNLSPDTSKKLLYQKISQFLSPETNSLIYEELFLSDYAAPKTDSPVKKRTRKR